MDPYAMDDTESSYYASRITQHTITPSSNPPSISVTYADESRGRILTATQSCSQGDILWIESPVLGMAHLKARKVYGGCIKCGRTRPREADGATTASSSASISATVLRSEWTRVTSVLAEEEARKQRKKNKGKKVAAAEEVKVEMIQLPAVLPYLEENASAASASSSSASSTNTSSLYCSTSCHSRSSAVHDILFSKSPPSTKLQKFTADHNEMLLLACEGIVKMMIDALEGVRQEEEVKEWMKEEDEEKKVESKKDSTTLEFGVRLYRYLATQCDDEDDTVHPFETLLDTHITSSSYSLQRFISSPFESKPWWELIPLPEDVDDETEGEDWRQTLCGVVEQTWEMLKEVVEEKVKQVSSAGDSNGEDPIDIDSFLSLLQLDHLLSISMLSHLLCAFELNNIGFHSSTEIGRYVSLINMIPSEEEKQAAITAIGKDVWQFMTTSLPYNISLEGTGLFAVACCMNHSCVPNVTVVQKNELHSNNHTTTKEKYMDLLSDDIKYNQDAVFVALRDIEAGEELNISYIDLVQPVAKEQAVDSSSSSASSNPSKEVEYEEIGYEQRQAALQAYGFTCVCKKCVEKS